MKLFKSFIAAFSTYSRIPVPPVRLDSDDMRYSMVFFPFIGLAIGALEVVWRLFAFYFELPSLAYVVLAAAIPLILTGGIHLDGFVDSMDAIHCFGGVEKRMEILKDPHIGAFAILKLIQYAALYVVFLSVMSHFGDLRVIIAYAIGFFVSRTLSGLSVTYFKGAKKKGMVASVQEQSDKKHVGIALIVELAVGIAALVVVSPVCGSCAAAAALLCLAYYKHASYKDFGGVTGDTSGCFLSMTELVIAFVLAVSAFVLAIL